MDEVAQAATSLDKAIDLLFHLHRHGGSCGVTEIGDALGQPKSSIHRLLSTLTRRGLVERDGRGRYRPGPGLIALGLGALEREPVVAVARPILEAEAAALGETVFLTAPRAGGVMVLDKVDGRGFLRAAPRVGDHVPAHLTAVGRVVMAFAPEALAPGPRGLGVGSALEAAVALAARRGYAESHGDWIEGLSVVAAPVFGVGPGGRHLVAALAAAAPTPRLLALGVARIAARLGAAAEQIEERLGGPAAGAGGGRS
jgi:IclR family acetate operon transcriptional repressor